MGKGDVRSKKGKISNGTYGNKRKRASLLRAEAKAATATSAAPAKAPAKEKVAAAKK